jgi:ABC-type nitrate/sulfonate/bicarbonate transport system substrate-binding protein
MSKHPAVLIFLLCLIITVDAHAAAVKPKLVIAHAAMNFRVAPLWIAQDQGFFAKYGIDPEVVYMRSGPTLVSGMLSGDIQIGWTASGILAPVAEGIDFVILAGFNNRVTDDLVVRPGIKRPEDLRGKRFGVQSIRQAPFNSIDSSFLLIEVITNAVALHPIVRRSCRSIDAWFRLPEA